MTWYTRGYLPHLDLAGATQFVTLVCSASASGQASASAEGYPDAPDWLAWDRRLDRVKDGRWFDDEACADEMVAILKRDDGVRCSLFAYVVMPNHLHVLLRQYPDHGITRLVAGWKGVSARFVNRTWNRTGPVWQREFWDRAIRDRREFEAVMNYIRMNPVNAGFVERPEAWRWSGRCEADGE